ncbi:tuber borchii white collar-1 [Pyronema domesticum]|nr:tuber borchii white collar-1 [Pyronema domesticum]
MDIDGDELGGYLGSSSYSDLAAAHAAAADGGVGNHMNGMQVNRNGGGGYGQSTVETSGADMDTMVNERRRSLANDGFGLGFLSMGGPGDDDSFDVFAAGHMNHGAQPLGAIPTTIEEVCEPSITFQYSVPEMNPAMTMFAQATRAGSMTPRAPLASPMPIDMMDSVPTSPAMGLHRAQQPRSLSTSAVSSDMMQGLTQSSIDQTMANHSTIPDMVTGSEQSLTTTIEKPSRPAPSRFAENVYSSSGFDMLDILNRVANRPDPQINLGAVDMSCAFVVTDGRKFDNPIVYCSATFERLTGYTKHEVLGRNCRFLQAPDGNIKSGDRRKYVDENTVFYLKRRIAERTEAQASLINYRKGGQSFTNLLTMIPVPIGDGSGQFYFVGFQVDLVDQPSAMMNKNRDGTFAVNYQYPQLPTYVPAMIMDQRPKMPIGRDDVSNVLTAFGSSDHEHHSKRVLDKVLLENTDDVVHVLSLKGLFLYCSPSIRKVLEYEPHELVGTSLSGVCHPSDIVPVTRDLKDTSTSSSVSVLFRIRRKFSGYTWFESHGSLHTEQGKGRKCIILVGRERPVYVLPTRQVALSGGIGDNELWTKLSTSGMFLHVSSNSKALLDRESEELVGTSIQALMRPDSKHELGKALQAVRTGERQTVRHEIQNKRGQFLQASTTLYPGDGDGSEFKRPTFLIAQTKLLKHTRVQGSAASPQHKSNAFDTAPSSHGSTPSSGWSSTKSSSADDRSKGTETETPPAPESQGEDNLFEELKTTRSTSWQFELRLMQKNNKKLAEEYQALLASKKKRKRRKGADQLERDCANCHTRTTPEWRRGPSGKRDLCNSCGLRYAKLQKVSRSASRTAPSTSDKAGGSSPQPGPSNTQSMNAISNGATVTSPIMNSPNMHSPNMHSPTMQNREPSTPTNGQPSPQMNMRQVPLDLQQMRHMQHNDQMSKNMAAVSTRMLDERMLNEEQSDMRRGSMGSMGMMQQQMQ